MTIQAATQDLRHALQTIYDPREAANIANLVMEKLTNLPRMTRITEKDSRLSELNEHLLRKFTDQLLDHQPVQYVLNEAWFFGLKFYVDSNVLIPRPETEELVQWVLDDLQQRNLNSMPSVLDVGTGSGCIPVTLKIKLPNSVIHSCDISDAAIAVAARNAAAHQVEVAFLHCDLLDEKAAAMLPRTDILISNPPYIPASERQDMAVHVIAHEPSTALFVPDNDPLIFYRAIASLALTRPEKPAIVYVEIHEKRGPEILALFRSLGFHSLELKKDMQGRDRMIRASTV